MSDVTCHPAIMKGDIGRRTASLYRIGMRTNRDVNIRFSYNGDVHFISALWVDKGRKKCAYLLFKNYFRYFVPSNQWVMGQNKKRKRRNYKYHAITFKLSAGQYRSLRNYCKARRTTPIKLIKKNIERFITAYEYEVPQDLYLTENQLDLFDQTL